MKSIEVEGSVRQEPDGTYTVIIDSYVCNLINFPASSGPRFAGGNCFTRYYRKGFASYEEAMSHGVASLDKVLKRMGRF